MKTLSVAITLLATLAAGGAAARDPAASEPMAGCGTFQYEREHVGPNDYRTINPATLKLVQDFHFTRQVEMLRHGQSSTIGGDIRYTLNAIPNHPRALRSMTDYFRRDSTRATTEMGMNLECWYNRAISYRPDDPMVRILYADELLRQGKRNEAAENLKIAEQYADDSSTVHYNLGLLYLDLKDYNSSVQHAQKAYALGAALPGLKNKLAQAGKWQ